MKTTTASIKTTTKATDLSTSPSSSPDPITSSSTKPDLPTSVDYCLEFEININGLCCNVSEVRDGNNCVETCPENKTAAKTICRLFRGKTYISTPLSMPKIVSSVINV